MYKVFRGRRPRSLQNLSERSNLNDCAGTVEQSHTGRKSLTLRSSRISQQDNLQSWIQRAGHLG